MNENGVKECKIFEDQLLDELLILFLIIIRQGFNGVVNWQLGVKFFCD